LKFIWKGTLIVAILRISERRLRKLGWWFVLGCDGMQFAAGLMCFVADLLRECARLVGE